MEDEDSNVFIDAQHPLWRKKIIYVKLRNQSKQTTPTSSSRDPRPQQSIYDLWAFENNYNGKHCERNFSQTPHQFDVAP